MPFRPQFSSKDLKRFERLLGLPHMAKHHHQHGTISDQDGKSKTASAVNAPAYPEQNEVVDHTPEKPDAEAIRQRAHELWIRKGRPAGTADQDWREAEQELQDGTVLRADLQSGRKESGSVQP